MLHERTSHPQKVNGRTGEKEMNQPPDEMCERILYILHRGLVEIRHLAPTGNYAQIRDLTEALELLPVHLHRWSNMSCQEIEKLLATYQSKNKGHCYEYVKFLGEYDLPTF
jgi:hypothetical protein